jgi:hypothetical protein
MKDNMNKKTIIGEKVKSYVESIVKSGIVKWEENEEGLNLWVKGLYDFDVKLSVIDWSRKSVWGIGWKRNGGLGWSFKYSKDVIESFENDEEFKYGINMNLINNMVVKRGKNGLEENKEVVIEGWYKKWEREMMGERWGRWNEDGSINKWEVDGWVIG